MKEDPSNVVAFEKRVKAERVARFAKAYNARQAAWEEIQRLAEAKLAKRLAPNRAQAIRQVIREEEELWERYRRALPGSHVTNRDFR